METAVPTTGGSPLGRLGRWISIVLELGKVRITSAVTISVVTGHIFFAEEIQLAALVPALGVFLLSCGSATLNHVQEWRLDAQMARTRTRPIPSGRISPLGATLLGLVFIVGGLHVLSHVPQHTDLVVALGAFSVVWYNAVYVFLKRLTSYAVIPGGLLGSIPPVMGWLAAGGVWNDPRILDFAVLFFLWQIPHFWLLLQLYGKQYEGAGFRSPTASMDPGQFRRVTVAWIVLVAAAGLVMAVTLRFAIPWMLVSLVNATALGMAAVLSLRSEAPAERRLFIHINVFMLVNVLLIVVDALGRGRP